MIVVNFLLVTSSLINHQVHENYRHDHSRQMFMCQFTTSFIVGILSKETGANARNVSTSFLPYGGITYFINSFDYHNCFSLKNILGKRTALVNPPFLYHQA